MLAVATALALVGSALAALPVAASAVPLSQPTVVVPANGSATVKVGSIPEGATSVVIEFVATGAWRPTDLSASFSEGTNRRQIMTARPGGSSSKVTLSVSSASRDDLKLWSTSASVRVSATVISSTATRVVRPRQSADFSIGKVPAESSHVRLRVSAVGSWRNTVITASAGGSTWNVMTATPNGSAREIALPITDGRDEIVVLSSRSASVRISVKILGFETRRTDGAVHRRVEERHFNSVNR